MSEPTHHSHTIVQPKIYVIIFGILLCFTALTLGASYLELGVFNAVVALTIAVIKAVLVILFFMHVKYSSRLISTVILGGLFWLSILLALTLSDFMSRGWFPGGARLTS